MMNPNVSAQTCVWCSRCVKIDAKKKIRKNLILGFDDDRKERYSWMNEWMKIWIKFFFVISMGAHFISFFVHHHHHHDDDDDRNIHSFVNDAAKKNWIHSGSLRMKIHHHHHHYDVCIRMMIIDQSMMMMMMMIIQTILMMMMMNCLCLSVCLSLSVYESVWERKINVKVQEQRKKNFNFFHFFTNVKMVIHGSLFDGQATCVSRHIHQANQPLCKITKKKLFWLIMKKPEKKFLPCCFHFKNIEIYRKKKFCLSGCLIWSIEIRSETFFVVVVVVLYFDWLLLWS